MSDFDPYHIWLGIPETARPISKYRLLGIDDFENNTEVIGAAAERQTIYLRTLQAGEHAVLVADLLNEVSQARVTLLNADQKAEYDEGLRKQQTPEPEEEPVPEQDPLAFAADELAAISSRPATRSRSGAGKPFWQQPWAIPTGAGGIVVLLLLMWLFGSGEEPKGSGLGQEKELQAEIAALKEKLVAAGNSKAGLSARVTVGKTSGPLESASQAANALAAAERAIAESVVTLKGHSAGVQSVAFSPDGKRIVSGSDDKTVKIWDAETEQEKLTLKGYSGTIRSVAFSPDGKQIVSGSDDNTVKVWNSVTGEEVSTLKGHSGNVLCVAWSLSGNLIVSGSHKMKIWAAETAQLILTIKGGGSDVRSVAFSPDGKHIASGYPDANPQVWDSETGQLKLTLKGHSRGVNSVVFSPDGNWIASGSSDNTMKIWDAETGQEKLTLKGNSEPVMSVAFSPDGKWLVSAAYDATVRLWETQTGHLILTLKGHSGGVMSVAFSSDGKRIVSGGQDGTIKIWDLGSAPATANTFPSSLQQGLVAYYPFNGNAKDESGNGNHVTVHGATLTQDRHGTADRAYHFNGIDNLLESKNVLPRFDIVTFAAWTRSASDKHGIIVATKSMPPGIGLTVPGGEGYLFGLYLNRTPVVPAQDNLFVMEPRDDERFYHVVGVSSGANMTLYLDGRQISSRDITPKEATTDKPVLIGGENKTSGPAYFNGDIDDIRIYNRALSAAEVKALYDFEKP
jgi:WD40 repeat protein